MAGKARRAAAARLRAFRELERRSVGEWWFQNKLWQAKLILASAKPETESDKLALKDHIKWLQNMLPKWGPRKASIGIKPIAKSDFIKLREAAAARAAAQLARMSLRQWCKENRRRRAGGPKIAQEISKAIKTISFQWSLPAETTAKIRADVRRMVNKKAEGK
jgi:hypothetical protein